jgi:hypothetical protein
MGDPAMFLRVALTRLTLEGTDELLAEARARAQQIAAALPNDEMRDRFRKAEPIQPLGKFDR